MGELAQQVGTAIGSYGSLRDAIGQRDPVSGKWQPKEPDADDYRQVMEPHERGSILVAAVFEAFLSIYKVRIADMLRIASGSSGILPLGELHPDLVNRLASEASKAANPVLSMCIRALDYCPPVDLTFGEYLRAIITADVDLVREDQFDYRLAFIDAFRRRGIYPTGIKTLSVESLQLKVWNIGVRVQYENLGEQPPLAEEEITFGIDYETGQMFTTINAFLRDYADEIKNVNKREDIYDITKKYIAGVAASTTSGQARGLHQRINTKFSESTDFSRITGLAFLASFASLGVRQSRYYQGPSFQIQNLRLVDRIGPDGTQINHVIFSIVQRSGIVMKNGGKEFEHYVPVPEESDVEVSDDKSQRFEFRGGCTLIFDLDTLKLKYAISKPLLDNQSTDGPRIDQARLMRQYEYQYGSTESAHNDYTLYFGERFHNLSEPFSFLHQH